MAAGTKKKKRKEEAYIWKAVTSSRHITNLKEFILETFNIDGFSSFYCLLFPFHNRKSMFAVLHSDINFLKSGLLHLTGHSYCKKE
jgi:hypothetical protein